MPQSNTASIPLHICPVYCSFLNAVPAHVRQNNLQTLRWKLIFEPNLNDWLID